jgi:hypothetical protein
LPWQRAVRALTLKELAALAVPSKSLDQLAKVRRATDAQLRPEPDADLAALDPRS